jgi:hypothetical protein
LGIIRNGADGISDLPWIPTGAQSGLLTRIATNSKHEKESARGTPRAKTPVPLGVPPPLHIGFCFCGGVKADFS